MAKYLITGGCGFLGSNIARELLSRGNSVRIFDNLSTGKKDNLDGVDGDLELIVGDLTDAPAVKHAVEGIDYILHQAALPSVQRSIEDPITANHINVSGTVNLLKNAVDAGVKRVVYAASSSAYGDQKALVKTENLLPMPKSPYAVAKLTGEYYLQAFYECYGLETVSLRYFNVFGPHQDPNSEYSAVIPLFITHMLRGESPTIYGDGTQSRDFTYIYNNVQANILAAEAPNAAGQVFNIACGRSFSLLDLVNEINLILGTDIKPRFAEPRTGDVKHSLADISKAQETLKYQVEVDFHEGLRRTVEWYKQFA